jgi:ribosomal protein S18 acetylase RimI-like enzyme
MVHPDFQKLGLGSALTRHTNAVSDEKPGRTWAPARPSSHKLFNDNGFNDIGSIDHKLERWGGESPSPTYVVRRDA